MAKKSLLILNGIKFSKIRIEEKELQKKTTFD